MRFSAALLLWLACSVVYAQSAKDQLQFFSKGLRDAGVDFQQIVTGPNGEKIQVSQGRLEYGAPDRFRWQYLKPQTQLIVADGKKIWIYESDLKQVTVKAQDALNQDNPLSVLSRPDQLERFYTVKERADKQGVHWLDLTPKQASSSPFDKAMLGFNGNSLRYMRLFDGLGQVSEFTFGTWRKNSGLSAARFHFTVPKGVDVVE